MIAWVPDPNALSSLVEVLRLAQVGETKAQQQVRERTEQFSLQPEYSKYLAYVVSTPLEGLEPTARATAGYMLHNYIRTHKDAMPQHAVVYIKSVILPSILDPIVEVRRSSAAVVMCVIRFLQPQPWAEALSRITELLDGGTEGQDAAFRVLKPLCEDVPRTMEQLEIGGTKVLDVLIPKFINLVDSDQYTIRNWALLCLHPFLFAPKDKPSTLYTHVEAYKAALFRRAHDDDENIRKRVCTAMGGLLNARPEYLISEMDGVVDYMIHCLNSENSELSLEAAEFWLTFAESADLLEYLRHHLSKVAPVLLDKTVYCEDELINLGAFDDDADVPDRPEDIKPHHLSSKSHAQAHNEGTQPTASTSRAREGDVAEEEVYEDEDDEDYDDDDYDDSQEWSVRKCCAATLDTMAISFEAELLEILMPPLQNKLASDDWLQKESGILTLGAIAEGCLHALAPYIDSIFPYLLESLKHPKPLVRSIACWTLGRYCPWVVGTQASDEHKGKYFAPALEGLLGNVLGNNKKVQQAGCSALATVEEEAGTELLPHLQVVVQCLAQAFEKYQRKNMLILLDVVGTLAEAVQTNLNAKPYIDLLVPPLMTKWQTLQDDDPDLISVLECMSSVCIYMIDGFSPFSQHIFSRSLAIAQTNLAQYQQWSSNTLTYEQPDRNFLVVSLDLISAITQGLGQQGETLWRTGNTSTFTVVQMCMAHPDHSVRQSAFALIGDLAISLFSYLEQFLPSIMPIIVNTIEPEPKVEAISVCNNATWCAGEIALKYGSQMEPFASPLLTRLVQVLLSAKSIRSLTENAAVTIGRLGLVCPAVVAPHLEIFIAQWCQALADIKDNSEKDSAFRGICMVIQANPNGLTKHIAFFLNAIGRWQSPSPELNEMFAAILAAYKSLTGPGWATTMNGLPQPVTLRLRERYNV